MANKRMQNLKQTAAKIDEQEEVIKTADSSRFKTEEIMHEALNAKRQTGDSAAVLITKEKQNKELLNRAGFDFVDARTLTPNTENSYAIDKASINALAELIYESGNTTPIILREVEINEFTPHGLQIIDGERRYRAHMLLGEKYGEHWYMMPARIFKFNELTDEDTIFILHAENIGQRKMTAAERSKGFSVVAERISERRKNDPEYAKLIKGKKLRDVLAEQFGVSARTAQTELNISNLCESAFSAYEQGKITKDTANALSHLQDNEQEMIINQLKAGLLKKEELKNKTKKKPKSKTINDELKTAIKAIKKALNYKETPNEELIGEIKNLLNELDK